MEQVGLLDHARNVLRDDEGADYHAPVHGRVGARSGSELEAFRDNLDLTLALLRGEPVPERYRWEPPRGTTWS